MRIDSEKCMGCLECINFCPMDCILDEGGVARIEEDECVECGVCLRAGVCPNDALFMPETSLQYPRVIRAQFSDPGVSHPSTNQGGRGTEEMKTNDVTGRFRRGEFGMALEFGRPGIGTRLTEIEAEVDTVVSRGLATRFAEDGTLPVRSRLVALGIPARPNAKITLDKAYGVAACFSEVIGYGWDSAAMRPPEPFSQYAISSNGKWSLADSL